MRKGILAAVAATIASMGVASAAPVAVDLSTWVNDGGGNWTVAGDNLSVNQSLNSRPTVFHDNQNSIGSVLNGTITVSGGDNDFVGFVLGYNQGDIVGQAGTDFILIDWKGGTQSGWEEGLSISRVVGPIDAGGGSTSSDAWQHQGNVQFIERAATLGTTGWEVGTSYDFEILFTSSLIRVIVDGNLEFEITGTFSDGSFGFYNFSQPNVTYAGFTNQVIPTDPVPVPAALPLMAGGIAAMGAIRRRRKQQQAA